MLAKDYLAHLRHREGRFRSFLLTFLKHFLMEERRKARAQKRGGAAIVISLDQPAEEIGYLAEPVDKLAPDEVFERRWAQALMQRALVRLREDYAARGQSALFDALQDLQPRQPGGGSYARIAAALGMSEAAIKSAAQRLRERHRQILREEVAQTVAGPGEIDEELRYLRSVLARHQG
jgi:RNA polymerase sigma-70 factor (ECF subfamily)